MIRGFAGLLLAGLLVLAGCSVYPTSPAASVPATQGAGGEMVVFAASSLKDAFEEMVDGVGEVGAGKVSFNFGGSQALAAQLAQGARADVFASADEKNMSAAISSGSVASGTQRVLATNRLVVVVPNVAAKVSTLKELAMPGVKVVLAGASVPAGGYSLQALDSLSADPAFGNDFKSRTLANVVSYENNVRQVLAKVQLGEADAGIVYATDAGSAGADVKTLPIPDSLNVVALYYIAPVKDAPNPVGAQRFIEYVLSAEGQSTLARYGFGPADQGQ